MRSGVVQCADAFEMPVLTPCEQNPYTVRRRLTMHVVYTLIVWMVMCVMATNGWTQTATSKNAGASPRLLTPQNSVIVLIVH